MLREGQTNLLTIDALPGKRTPNSFQPTVGEVASSINKIQAVTSRSSNDCMSDISKTKLAPLIMPNNNHQTGLMEKESIHSTTSASNSASELSFSSNDRKRPTSHFSPMISSKRSCLPFGYCYDTANESDLWLLEDDSDAKLELPCQSEEDLWMLSDDRTPDLLLSNNPWISNRSKGCRSSKVMRDVGPTLAQLNSSSDVWDTLDLDELLSCSSAANVGAATSCAMNQTPKNYNHPNAGGINNQPSYPQPSANIGPSKSGQTRGIKKEKENIEVRSAIELQDPKLQANVEYLQSLVSNSVNQSSLDAPITAPRNPSIHVSHPEKSARKNKPYAIQHSPSVVPPSIPDQVKSEYPLESHQQPQQSERSPASSPATAKRKLITKRDGDGAKTKILGSTHQAKNEKNSYPAVDLESKCSNEDSLGGEGCSNGNKGSIKRTRNSNSQCTERSNVSSNDEGFVEEADERVVDEEVEMEDIEEEDDDNESEVMDSDDESFYGDYEAKDLLGATTSDDQENRWALNMGRTRKGGPQRYFWQYNVQAKGPKGSKSSLNDSVDTLDPHILGEVSDPVFAPDCQVQGVKHAGKARRGDGNDLTPNPRKLLMIGLELKKLSKTINDLTPVADVPVAARNKTRKEKNKLASRACRLKKKAQHEANKIKLYGLQNEHHKMLRLLAEIKSQVRKILTTDNGRKVTALTASMASLFNDGVEKVIVAGNTSDFVNSVSCLPYFAIISQLIDLVIRSWTT